MATSAGSTLTGLGSELPLELTVSESTLESCREPPYSEIAPCRFAEGRLRTFYHSDYFRSVTRHPEVGELDAAAAELIELYDALAASPEIHLDMWLEPGDVQLVSNHTIVHARSAYRDAPERGRVRHLLRLWLSFQ